MEGGVMNSVRQGNGRAEGQRSIWVDVGLKLDGREDQAHIAIFDHPKNAGYPQHWRVDGQMGVGPCRAITGDWKIAKGKSETIRHQFFVYTGKLNRCGSHRCVEGLHRPGFGCSDVGHRQGGGQRGGFSDRRTSGGEDDGA